ncbi:MAG: LysR family transcriptional regulator [Silicimonas sp.]|nr:LysR family transcriptional regulator [Silicimonas sp.]
MGVEKLRLTALRAFDLVARTGSFTRAAEVLNVTRPAISKQIKALETDLGVSLITRFGPRLALTETGETLAQGLRQGFDLIAATTARIEANRAQPKAIRILVERDFATSWLAERIGDFLVQNPGLPVEITSDQNNRLRLDEEFSFRIFYGPTGRAPHGDLVEIPLCDWVDLPLCAPEYAAEHVTETGFVNARFLVDRYYNPWEVWFDRTGLTGPADQSDFIHFNETTLCLRAAQTGAGITIGDTLFSLGAVEQGRLVVPFGTGVKSRERYVLCHAKGRALNEGEAEFQGWLRAAVAEYQSRVDGVLEAQGIRVLP